MQRYRRLDLRSKFSTSVSSEVNEETAEKKRKRAREWNAKLRQDCLNAYGTTCARCGTDKNLELHHINGDGREHRLAVSGDHQQTLKSLHDLRKRGFPPVLQTLCRDCHIAVEIEKPWAPM